MTAKQVFSTRSPLTSAHMTKLLFTLPAIAACVLSGCGGPDYEVAPVRGIVKLNDKTLQQGGIMFSPVAKGDTANVGRAATGRLQPDGTYTLTTFEKGDGAIVGEHWVTIVNHDEDNLPDGVPEFARIQVPEKKVVVSGKENQIDIILSRDDVKKYSEDDR
jgi:hypothetical protein